MQFIKIPKKYQNFVDYYFLDNDGYWLRLKSGFISSMDDSHTIHEYFKNDIIYKLQFIKKCTCNECKAPKK